MRAVPDAPQGTVGIKQSITRRSKEAIVLFLSLPSPPGVIHRVTPPRSKSSLLTPVWLLERAEEVAQKSRDASPVGGHQIPGVVDPIP